MTTQAKHKKCHASNMINEKKGDKIMAVVTVYTVDEVNDLLEGKISKTSIYRAIALNRLKAVKVGKRYLINEEALNNFLSGNFESEC